MSMNLYNGNSQTLHIPSANGNKMFNSPIKYAVHITATKFKSLNSEPAQSRVCYDGLWSQAYVSCLEMSDFSG